jgi:hypothetical protein
VEQGMSAVDQPWWQRSNWLPGVLWLYNIHTLVDWGGLPWQLVPQSVLLRGVLYGVVATPVCTLLVQSQQSVLVVWGACGGLW